MTNFLIKIYKEISKLLAIHWSVAIKNVFPLRTGGVGTIAHQSAEEDAVALQRQTITQNSV